MKRFQHFQRGSGVYVCGNCGKRTRDTEGEGDVGMCFKCYERGGWENTHSDNDHEHDPDPNCPVCQEAAGTAQR
jgi:DNA-directed RNA polymerase subunit RPC12/RpoP